MTQYDYRSPAGRVLRVDTGWTKDRRNVWSRDPDGRFRLFATLMRGFKGRSACYWFERDEVALGVESRTVTAALKWIGGEFDKAQGANA